MTKASEAQNLDAQPDGRRQRSQRSRRQIVEAMLALVRQGNMRPSAAQVAEESGVSLRTVFRHFEEMDELFREMTTIIEAEVMPILARPYQSSHWRDQLDELLAKRVELYERIMPMKVSGSLRRFQSNYLMEDHKNFLELERSGLDDVLPKTLKTEVVLFSALEMAMGFQAWRHLRQDQGLSVKNAEATMRFAVGRLLEGR